MNDITILKAILWYFSEPNHSYKITTTMNGNYN